MKVRKHDGNLVKVKRRVTPANDLTSLKPKLTVVPGNAKDVLHKGITQATRGENASPDVGTSDAIQPMNVEKPAGSIKPTTTSTPSKHRSKSAGTYRLFRGVHSVHRHFRSLIGNFDPDGDLGDVASDADGYEFDSYTESSTSSSDNERRDRHKNRRKSGISNSKDERGSVYSYAEGDSD